MAYEKARQLPIHFEPNASTPRRFTFPPSLRKAYDMAVQLPDNYDIGFATLKRNGAVELANGMTLVDCEMTDMKIGNAVVDIVPGDSGTVIDVRCDNGQQARFVHSGSHWYRVAPGESVPKAARSLFGGRGIATLAVIFTILFGLALVGG